MSDALTQWGLTQRDCEVIRGILAKVAHVDRAVLFGSRAMGMFGRASDIDLALEGKNLEWEDILSLRSEFEESPLPFDVDLVIRAEIVNPELEKQIKKHGRMFYEKTSGKYDKKEWKDERFGDLLVGGTRNGIYKSKEFHGRGQKIINMGELFAYPRLPAVPMQRIELTDREQEALSVMPGDLLFARRSLVIEGAGKCSVVMSIDEPTVFESSIVRARPNKDKVDSLFLFYYFSSPLGKNKISSIAREMAVSGITGTDLAKLVLTLPPLPVQKRIAETLGVLDDKIELNRRMNATLEQIAQAIFKSWFVDFEPWGGKRPEGWWEGVLNDICSYRSDRIAVSSLTPQSYISTENMLANKGGFVDAASLPTVSQTTMFQPGDVLVSNIRPYFKKIVFCSFAGGCSTDVLCFHARERLLSLYLYYILFNDSFFDYMVAGSKGTKMPRGDKQQIMNFPVTIPTNDVIRDFAAIVEPMMTRITANKNENARLATLRDMLLPKLMNGEIGV